MNSEDIYHIEFSKPRAGRRGYQIDEVDEFLDVLVVAGLAISAAWVAVIFVWFHVAI